MFMPRLSNEAVFILRKLYSWNKVGNKYINLHDVIRAFPRRLRNTKFFRAWIKDLCKEDLVIIHKNGTCISLNKHELGRTEEIINR